MMAETSRDWFCKQANFLAGASGVLIANPGANKIPVVTYCAVTIITAAAANSISIEGAPGGVRAFEASVGTLSTFFMGPVFRGVELSAGDNIMAQFSGGAADISVVIEGYWKLP